MGIRELFSMVLLLPLIQAQLNGQSQSALGFPSECCTASLMNAHGHVVLEGKPHAKKVDQTGLYTKLQAKFCTNDEIHFQIWEPKFPGSDPIENNMQFELVWEHVVHTSPGWTTVDLTNNPANITLSSRIGLYAPRPTDDDLALSLSAKFPVPYVFNATNEMYISDVIFDRGSQQAANLVLGAQEKFDRLRWPMSFKNNIAFSNADQCLPIFGDNPGGGGVYIPGPAGPPGPPGPEIGCDIPDFGTMPDDVDKIKGNTDKANVEIENLKKLIQDLLNQSKNPSGTCTSGFQPGTYGVPFCYMVFRERMTYGNAVLRCREYGAILAAIDSEPTQLFLKSEIMSTHPDGQTVEDYWTRGMYSHDSYRWVWYDDNIRVKDDMDFTNWAQGYPKINTLFYQCMNMQVNPTANTAYWVSSMCEEWKYFICERPKICL